MSSRRTHPTPPASYPHPLISYPQFLTPPRDRSPGLPASRRSPSPLPHDRSAARRRRSLLLDGRTPPPLALLRMPPPLTAPGRPNAGTARAPAHAVAARCSRTAARHRRSRTCARRCRSPLLLCRHRRSSIEAGPLYVDKGGSGDGPWQRGSMSPHRAAWTPDPAASAYRPWRGDANARIPSPCVHLGGYPSGPANPAGRGSGGVLDPMAGMGAGHGGREEGRVRVWGSQTRRVPSLPRRLGSDAKRGGRGVQPTHFVST